MNTTNGKIKTITMSALGLALSVVSLILFRGPTSIFSTFLIPAILVIFSGNRTYGYALTSMGLLFVTLFFFPTQLVFVSGYVILGHLLRLLSLSTNHRVKVKSGKFILYMGLTSLVLYSGIRLTQFLFLVPLHTMMLGLSRGNPLLYAGILAIEGLFISVFNFGILKLFFSRTEPF